MARAVRRHQRDREIVVPFTAHGLDRRGADARLGGEQLDEAADALHAGIAAPGPRGIVRNAFPAGAGRAAPFCVSHVVINAAGLMSLAPIVDFDLAVLDRMHRTNIRGTFVVNQQAARRLRPGGSIVNFSSSVLGRILPTYAGYAASKAAIEAMTFILAHELRGRDITVNAVAPM